MYKKDDVVVYRRDVCKVIGREVSDMTGEDCYILVPYQEVSSSTIMKVPVSNKAGHLRNLITKDKIDELINKYPSIEALMDKPANMKSQYVALLKGDNIEDLLCIMKTSYSRNQIRIENRKKVAAIDGEYLQKAEKYLFNEMAVALGLTFDESKDYFIEGIRKVS